MDINFVAGSGPVKVYDASKKKKTKQQRLKQSRDKRKAKNKLEKREEIQLIETTKNLQQKSNSSSSSTQASKQKNETIIQKDKNNKTTPTTSTTSPTPRKRERNDTNEHPQAKRLQKHKENDTTNNHSNKNNDEKNNSIQDNSDNANNTKEDKKNVNKICSNETPTPAKGNNKKTLTSQKNNKMKNFEINTPLFFDFEKLGNDKTPTNKKQAENENSKEMDKENETIFSAETFEGCGLDKKMIKTLTHLNFKLPTKIQSLSIPPLLLGKDCLIKSQTGSGKTLAYLLPIVHNLAGMAPSITRADGMVGLVVAPTRELTIQIYTVLQKILKRCHWIVPGHVMGGEKKKSEKSRIRKGVNVMVATPGRFVDHLNTTENCSVAEVRWLVLDEADRLLDMGFEKDIVTIVNACNSQNSLKRVKRTNILCSATLDHNVQQLANFSLINPVECFADDTEMQRTKQLQLERLVMESEKASENMETDKPHNMVIPAKLKQGFATVPSKLRLVSLVSFLLRECVAKSGKILVFFGTCDSVDFHYSLFKAALCGQDGLFEGVKIGRLHGEMKQHDRMETFKSFGSCEKGFLFATDVAARGLDLPALEWIVQYNLPMDCADYVHRVGRTARGGAVGQAVVFLTLKENGFNEMIENHHGIKMLDYTADITASVSQLTGVYQTRMRKYTTEEAASRLQSELEEAVKEDEELRTLSGRAFQSFIRSMRPFQKI